MEKGRGSFGRKWMFSLSSERSTGRMRILENGTSVRLTELPSIIAVSPEPEIITAYSVTTFSRSFGCAFPSVRMTAALRQLRKHRNFPSSGRTIWQFARPDNEAKWGQSGASGSGNRKLVTDNEFPPAPTRKRIELTR